MLNFQYAIAYLWPVATLLSAKSNLWDSLSCFHYFQLVQPPNKHGLICISIQLKCKSRQEIRLDRIFIFSLSQFQSGGWFWQGWQWRWSLEDWLVASCCLLVLMGRSKGWRQWPRMRPAPRGRRAWQFTIFTIIYSLCTPHFKMSDKRQSNIDRHIYNQWPCYYGKLMMMSMVKIMVMVENLRSGEEGRERLEEGTTSLLKDNFHFNKLTIGSTAPCDKFCERILSPRECWRWEGGAELGGCETGTTQRRSNLGSSFKHALYQKILWCS